MVFAANEFLEQLQVGTRTVFYLLLLNGTLEDDALNGKGSPGRVRLRDGYRI